MIITGGAYHEHCQFPPNKVFYGSGVRAAAATQTITPTRNHLYTCIGDNDTETLSTYADTFDFDVHTTEIPETITFDYLHNHSNPRIINGNAPNDIELSGIDGRAILRFGLVEGSATVSGARVVYDPQSSDPSPFRQNGSNADELALVLNRDEAAQLTGETEINAILTELITGSHDADVAVVKRGAEGAIVRTPGETSRIPAFQTDSVWGIGSGDIFSAVFAAEWAENYNPAPDAALTASQATANYCQHQRLPIPENPANTGIQTSSANFTPPNASHPTIYLAAPFFDIGEYYLVEEVKHVLESEGADVFSPIHEVGRAANFDDSEEVASKDLAAIENADLIFALLDHPDTGTYFEVGYARRSDVPVIGYAHDSTIQDDTMLYGTGCRVYGDLASAVYNAIWQANA